MGLEQQVLVMAMAAIQADGKTMSELTQAEKEAYIFSAAEDLKFALDVLQERKNRPDPQPKLRTGARMEGEEDGLATD